LFFDLNLNGKVVKVKENPSRFHTAFDVEPKKVDVEKLKEQEGKEDLRAYTVRDGRIVSVFYQFPNTRPGFEVRAVNGKPKLMVVN